MRKFETSKTFFVFSFLFVFALIIINIINSFDFSHDNAVVPEKFNTMKVSSYTGLYNKYENTKKLEPLLLANTTPLTTGGSLSSGTYILESNLNLTTQIEIKSGVNVIIDLNGHVLQKSSGFIGLVQAGGILTIIDSNPSVSHYGTLSNEIWKYNKSATTGVRINGGIMTGGTGDRGGSFLVRGELILEAGTIAGSVAQESDPDQTNEIHQPTGGAGGAIFIDQGGKFTMNGGAIMYSSSDPDIESLGGAVFIDAEGAGVGTFEMNGGLISNCKSSKGGAVYVHEAVASGVTKQAVFEMNGGTINDNKTTSNSSGNGGAIYVNGIFTMNNGKIENNSTYNTNEVLDGVGLYSSYGGAVYTASETALFTMNDGELTGNKAASGGAVMVWSGSTFIMNGGTISNNIASGSGGLGNGGAVYVMTSTFDFNKGTMENNWARRYGGAININKTATLNLDGECKVLNNSANHGGGISQEDGDCAIKLDNEGILISENTSREGNGGGLFIEKGVLNISKGTITNNTAGSNGGGIALYVSRVGGDITVNMTGGYITKNTATVSGGGIDIYADHTNEDNETNDVMVNLTSGTIDNNQSNGEGGGINVWVNKENGTANMEIGKTGTGPNIQNNVAQTNGGAISLYNGSINMKTGLINENTSNENGSGIYIGGTGTFTMDGGKVSKNISKEGNGGGIYVASGNITMNNGNIENNESKNGGGFYLTTGTFEIKNGSQIKENKAINGGGGYVSDGTFKLTGGTTSKNVATENGGGYYIVDTPTVSLTNGIISDNKATNGGGFYQTQTGTQTTSTTLSGTCYVNNNIAENGNGGGIYVDGGSTFRVINGKVIYNNATGEPSYNDTKSYAYNGNVQTSVKMVYTKDSSAGVGGGVYIKDGIFTMKKTDGTNGTAAIFGNKANYAADDLFAYGNGKTTFDAIPVTTMEKDDAYLNATDWFEDYPKGEYHNSLKIADSNVKITSFDRYKNIYDDNLLVKADSVLSTSTDYISITMGANVGNVILNIDDYYVGEDNTFIYTLKNEQEEIMKISVKKEEETKVVNIPIGKYTLTLNSDWSWRYTDKFKATIKRNEVETIEENNSIILYVTGGQTINVNTAYNIKNKKYLSKNLFTKITSLIH